VVAQLDLECLGGPGRGCKIQITHDDAAISRTGNGYITQHHHTN
jgi:hypothetical protein